MTLLFDPLAKREFGDAFEYYEAQQQGLGERFRRAIWGALGIVERYPEIGQEVRPGIRKILLKRFPYKRIYSVTGNTIYMLAVAHGHREPDYWVGRA